MRERRGGRRRHETRRPAQRDRERAKAAGSHRSERVERPSSDCSFWGETERPDLAAVVSPVLA
jgi:hypothetical protein